MNTFDQAFLLPGVSNQNLNGGTTKIGHDPSAKAPEKDIYSLGHVLARKFRPWRVSYTVVMIGLAAGVVRFVGIAFSPLTTAILTP